MFRLLTEFRARRAARHASGITRIGAAERVAAGAVFLDDQHPGWYRHIDPERLELADGSCCVLGQLHGEFRLGLSRSSLWNLGSAPRASLSPARLGFQCIGGVSESLQEQDYDFLNSAWRAEIRHRLDAELEDREAATSWHATVTREVMAEFEPA